MSDEKNAGAAKAGWRAFVIDRSVFVPATLVLLALVVFASLAPSTSETLFADVQSAIVRYASWYYVLVVAIILVAL